MKKLNLVSGCCAGVLMLLANTAMAEDNPNRKHTNQLTAEDQSNTEAMTERTRKIRAAITDDDSLSTSAHNVKIITNDKGMVTLKGPVSNAAEKQKIETLAGNIAGAGNVRSEITVGQGQARSMLNRDEDNLERDAE